MERLCTTSLSDSLPVGNDEPLQVLLPDDANRKGHNVDVTHA